MTSFESNSKNSGNIFGFSNGRKRRQESTRKTQTRKVLDQFVLEKMEDRWLPAVSWVNSGNVLTFTFSSDGDNLTLTPAPGSAGTNNFTFTGSSLSPPASLQPNVSSVIFNDLNSNHTSQMITLPAGSSPIVVPLVSNSIETVTFSGANITSNLSVIGTGSTFSGTTASCLSLASVTGSSLNVSASALRITSLTSVNSSVTLTNAFPGSLQTVNASNDSSIIVDSPSSFQNTTLTQSGGNLTINSGGKLAVLDGTNGISGTFNAGGSLNSATLHNGTGSSNLLFHRGFTLSNLELYSGSATMQGIVTTVNQTGGFLAINRDATSGTGGTVLGVLNITNGVTNITDNAELQGPVVVSGSTILTIVPGNGTAAIGANFTLNNGTANINGAVMNGQFYQVNGGNSTLTNVTFNSHVDITAGNLISQGGSLLKSSVSISGGTFYGNGTTLQTTNIASPTLLITGGTVSAINSTFEASSISNANGVVATLTAGSVNFGNSTVPGNNTFITAGASERYFISNQNGIYSSGGLADPLRIQAQGNIWIDNSTTYSPTTQPFAVANLLQGAASDLNNLLGPIYINGTNLYVVNNQQGLNQNNIQAAINASAADDTVFVQGGTPYNETPILFSNVTLAGDTVGNLPIIQPIGGSGFVFRVQDDYYNVAQTNTIRDFVVVGSSLTDPVSDKLVDVGYSASASSRLTLAGNIAVSGFSPTNSAMLSVLGGQLVVSTSANLSVSTSVSAFTNDVVFTLSNGSNLSGRFEAGVPAGNAQIVNIQGSLVGSSPAIFIGAIVNLTGSIDGPSTTLNGSTLTIAGGTITRDFTVTAGNLVMTSGTLSGSTIIQGGTSTISGGTFSTVTNESNVGNQGSTLLVTGGVTSISNASILASNASTSFRNAILIDGSNSSFAGANLTLGNTSITLSGTDNSNTSGIRTLGVASTLSAVPNLNLTLNSGVVVSGGQYSVLINGINSKLTGDSFGSTTMINPTTDFIKLENYAYYDQVTQIRGTLDANNVTFTSTSPSYSFKPSASAFTTSQLPTVFSIESRTVDYSSVPTLGYVSLYNTLNFVVTGRSIQPVVDMVGTGETVYIQNGTFAESVTIDSTKTGTVIIGANEYSPGNVTTVAPNSGSNAAFLVQSSDVQILGLTIDGSNGTTPLLNNGSLSGVSYGVTNFNGTALTPIGNLTVRNEVLQNLVRAGVYLNNNGTVLATGQVRNSTFTNIGGYGFDGGVITIGNGYTSLTNSTMTGVTNGFVMQNFSLASSGSVSVLDNNVSSYATGATLSNFTGAASAPTIGSSGHGNTFTLATGMNATLGANITGSTIGVYVQKMTGTSVPTLANNTIVGFNAGYDITNTNQPLTITGGTVSNASISGILVKYSQSFDPNTSSPPGNGTFYPNVTINGLTVNAVAGGLAGFTVDGGLVANGAMMTLDGGTRFNVGSAIAVTGVSAVGGSVLTVNQATLDATNSLNIGSIGISVNNSSVNIYSPANISGFGVGISQQGTNPVTVMTGGTIYSSVTGSDGIVVGTGNLTITGGNVTTNANAIYVTNATSVISIDSSAANTTIHGSNGLLAPSVASVTISKSTSNLTTIYGDVSAVQVGTGPLSISGGTYTSNSANAPTIGFSSTGSLTISAGTVQSPNLTNSIGIQVSNGNASISGVTLNGGASEGIRYTSTNGNLTITGNASVPVIAARNIGVNITASSATIAGGLIQASSGTGIQFSSTGRLNLNSNVSATVTGVMVTDGFANITATLISNAANGIVLNGATANGTIHDVTFSNNTNDLNLTSTTGGISLGANNVFSASGFYILNQTSQDFLIDGTTQFTGNVLSTLSGSNTTQRSTLFGIEDKIVDKIDNASFGLVRLKSSDLFVTPSSYYTPNTSADIQRAINAASNGYTIYVKNGSYVNNLNVNKVLNIQGDSSANTTITAANTSLATVTVASTNVTMSCLSLSGVSNSGTGLFVNSTLLNLQISNTTFSNLSQAAQIGSAGQVTTLGLTNLTMNGNTNGISLSTGGSLTNATLNQIEINQVSGTVFNLAGTVTDLTITNTNGSFGGNVMTIGGTTTNLTITNSNFSNGTGDAITLGAGVSLTNATLTNDKFDYAGGAFANLQGPVSGLTLTNVTASRSGGSVLTFGNTASSVTVSNVTATNANGTVLSFSALALTDLSVTNSNFATAGGNVLALGGTTTNLTVTGTNFSNATGTAFTLASGKTLTNATLSNDQFDNSGASFANLQGPVSGLTISSVTASNANGSVLTFGDTASSVTVSSVTATNANGSVLTLNGSTTNLSVSGSNFSNASDHGITLAVNKTLTNATFTNVQFNNLGGYGASFIGNVSGLTIQNSNFNNLSGTVLTLSGTSSNVNLTTVGMTTHTAGILVSGPVTTMLLSGVTVDGSGTGLSVTSAGSISGLSISGSTFNNGSYGILAQADTTVNTNQNRLTGVSITSSTFANNTNSGISLGMLNNALLSNLNIHDNGSSVAGSGGILLNLTNGTFTNVTLSNLTVSDNGLSGNSSVNGFGIHVGTTSGTLTNLTLSNVTISGSGTSANSMIGLELVNSVDLGTTSITGLTVSGSNSTGIYLIGQSTGQTLNIGNANLASSLSTYISDKSNGTVVTATSATFGGVSAGANLTVDQAYQIVDKNTDGVDEAGFGFVLIKSGSTYVTNNSYTTTSLTPSIQRAVNLATTGDTAWIQTNSGSANYTGGVNTATGGLTLTLNSGNSTTSGIVNTEGDWSLSSNTTLVVRVGGSTAGTYTQYNLANETTSMGLGNAVLSYSNISSYVPTLNTQYGILNQLSNSTNSTSSRLSANVTGNMTTLANGGRYQLVSGQYFLSVYEGGTGHNDFVLIGAPDQVSNVVVYGSWSSASLGDPVSYVNASNVTTQLTYGLTAASNITIGTTQLQASNSTLSVATGTYGQILSNGSFANNLTINLIGVSNISGTVMPDAQQIGNLTVSGITLYPNDTVNYRVNGGTQGQFDQLNTSGPISLGNAVANIAISSNFVAPGSLNSWLPLVNNTDANAIISGQFYYNNGTSIVPLNTGVPLSITNDSAHDLYTTYKFGTTAPYNDFALIWSLAPGTQTQVVVNANWSGVEFGAVLSYNNANYTIGLDGFAEMKSYDPVPATTLVGGVAAVSSNGTITIANGTYNGTFAVNMSFSLVAPTGNQSALFPQATGQTVLQSGANITSTSWTGNIRFGDLFVGSGVLFDNAASLVDTNGFLSFQSGATYANVSLSAIRSITIQSNVAGTPAILNSASGCTVISVTGSNISLALTDLTLGGTGRGMNLTNTGTTSLNNVAMGANLATASTINGPLTLNLNYPASSASNNLTITPTTLNLTPLGTASVSLLTANFALNANLGTTAGIAGNNTITLTSNMITGGTISSGNGQDSFNVGAAVPVTIQAGGGNDTLTMTATGSYVSSFDGAAGTDTIRGGNQKNFFDVNSAYGGVVYLSRGVNSSNLTFTNTENLIGNALVDTFSITSNSARMSVINGGNGNDFLAFSGTNGANASFAYSNQLEANVAGSSLGTVKYFNYSNATASVGVIDSFASAENLVGGSGDDVIRMGPGGSLSGTLNGGTGNNTLDYSTYSSGVTVNLLNKAATGIGSGSTLRTSNIRDVFGSSIRDSLTGDTGNNILVGNNGNDYITGGDGNDILIGSFGQDTVVGGAGWNLDIGGYVDFETGGNVATAYGIPSNYVDFVLRSMMNEWSGVTNDSNFLTKTSTIGTTGVSVATPGNVNYTNIRMYSSNGNPGPDGTVFDDNLINTITAGTLQQNWVFYGTRDVTTDGSKVKKSSQIYKLFP